MAAAVQAAGGETHAQAPAHESLAGACCRRWADDRARFALYHEDETGTASAWSFWDIQREANRLSNVLAALGVARGESVAIAAGQRPETAIGHIACYQMGAIALPLSPALAAEALAFRLDRAAARVVIADAAALGTLAGVRDRLARRVHVVSIGAAHLPWARAWAQVLPLAAARYAPASTHAEDPALLDADGELLTQGALLARSSAFAGAHAAYPQPGDLFWSPIDWTSAEGLCAGLLPVWSFGRPILGYSGVFDPEKAFSLIEKYGVRNSLLSAAQLASMMAIVPAPRAKYELELRSIVCSGPVGERVAAWAREELGVAIAGTLQDKMGEKT